MHKKATSKYETSQDRSTPFQPNFKHLVKRREREKKIGPLAKQGNIEKIFMKYSDCDCDGDI